MMADPLIKQTTKMEKLEKMPVEEISGKTVKILGIIEREHEGYADDIVIVELEGKEYSLDFTAFAKALPSEGLVSLIEEETILLDKLPSFTIQKGETKFLLEENFKTRKEYIRGSRSNIEIKNPKYLGFVLR
jgi:hypothetical protein